MVVLIALDLDVVLTVDVEDGMTSELELVLGQ